jgi:hypothetical protein
LNVSGSPSGDLANFPLLISLTSASGVTDFDTNNIFTELGSNKLKIRIADKNDNDLYTEIENWNESNKKAVLHTKLTSYPSSGTTLTLYYDSAQLDNTTYVGTVGTSAAQAVWDSDFVGVYHLQKAPSGAGTVLDSTSLSKDGNSSNMENGDLIEDVNGLKGWDFGGTNERGDVADSAEQSLTSDFSVETFYNFNNSGVTTEIFNKFNSGNTAGWGFYINGTSGPFFGFKVTNTTFTRYTRLDIPTGIHYFGGYYPGDGNDASIVFNQNHESWDKLTGGAGALNGITDSGQALKFAYGNVFHSTTLYGVVEIFECRYSKTRRSIAWRQTTYHSLIDNLITFS